jgi:hypothetical protein
MDSLQRLDLFGDRWEEETARLVAGVLRVLPCSCDGGLRPSGGHPDTPNALPTLGAASASVTVPGGGGRNGPRWMLRTRLGRAHRPTPS